MNKQLIKCSYNVRSSGIRVLLCPLSISSMLLKLLVERNARCVSQAGLPGVSLSKTEAHTKHNYNVVPRRIGAQPTYRLYHEHLIPRIPVSQCIANLAPLLAGLRFALLDSQPRTCLLGLPGVLEFLDVGLARLKEHGQNLEAKFVEVHRDPLVLGEVPVVEIGEGIGLLVLQPR